MHPAAKPPLCTRVPAAPRGEAAGEKECKCFTRSHRLRSYETRTVHIGWHAVEISEMERDEARADHTHDTTAQAALPTGPVDATTEITDVDCDETNHTHADSAQSALSAGSANTTAETICQLQALLQRSLSQSMHRGSTTTNQTHGSLHTLGVGAARPATCDDQLCNARYAHSAARKPHVSKLMSHF